MIVKRQGVSRVTVGADIDVSLLFLLTCLVQNFGKKCLREGLGRVLLGLAFFVIGRNLPERGYRQNRFHLIIPLCCINCCDPSLDIFPELLVLLIISAGFVVS